MFTVRIHAQLKQHTHAKTLLPGCVFPNFAERCAQTKNSLDMKFSTHVLSLLEELHSSRMRSRKEPVLLLSIIIIIKKILCRLIIFCFGLQPANSLVLFFSHIFILFFPLLSSFKLTFRKLTWIFVKFPFVSCKLSLKYSCSHL